MHGTFSGRKVSNYLLTQAADARISRSIRQSIVRCIKRAFPLASLFQDIHHLHDTQLREDVKSRNVQTLGSPASCKSL